jgi:outer membrane lipoprotein SlyB
MSMRELNQMEIDDVSGGALFGAIIGGVIGGVAGFVATGGNPIGAIAGSTLGAGLMSSIEDRVNQ